MRRMCRFSLCAGYVFAGSTVAMAGPVQLPEIMVTAPRESAVAPTTFHTVIDPARAPAALASVPDLLRRAPGTVVRQLGSPGQRATVSIRGSSAEQVVVLVDGARLNTGGLGAVDLSTIPVAAIERIEVIRGGGTTQFGTDAVGGVINIITKDADARLIEAAAGGGSFLTTTGHAAYFNQWDDKQFVATLQHLGSRGNYRFDQAATTLAGTTLAGGGTFTREHNRSLAESLLLKYRTKTDDHTTLSLLNDFHFGDRQLPGLEIETTQLAPANPLEAMQRLYRNSTQMEVAFDGVWSSRGDLTLGLHNTFESSHFQDASPALGSAIDRLTLNDAVNPYARFDVFAPTATGGHAFALRYDYRRDLFDDQARNATTVGAGQRGRSTHSVLLQDEWTVWEERLRVFPAARFTSVSDAGANGNYRLGMLGRPVPWLVLKGNIESSQRAPTFTELYHPDQGFLRGNPALDKERGWHWDAGLALEFPALTAEAGFFQQRLGNSILFVPISATTIAPVNTFAVRAEGVEAGVETTPLPFLRLTGNYTWLRAHFTGSGNQLPGRPTHTLNGELEFFGRLTRRLQGRVFGEVQWTSALPVTIENTVFLAARATVDAGIAATWTVRDGHEYFARAELQDLTNVQSYDARGFPLPRRALFVSVGGRWG